MGAIEVKHADETGEPAHVVGKDQLEDKSEQDDFEAASQGLDIDYSQFMPQLRPKKKWPKVVGWILVVLIIAGLAAGVWSLGGRLGTKKPAAQHHASTQQHKQAVPTTQSYTSSNFNLSLSYPNAWTLADTGNGKLTITSPHMQLTAADGQKQNGEVIFSIENQNSADMSMFRTGNAVAVLDSQKLSYTKPTSTQRADTYISFLQYTTTTVRGGLDGVYVTGDLGYQKDQIIPESDITKPDPLIRVTFVGCSDAKCDKSAPLTIASTMWSDQSFAAPVEKIIESLAIQ